MDTPNESNEPQIRAYTEEEIRAKFLAHVGALIKYWSTVHGPTTIQERVHGVAFSILSAIDGSSMAVPGFKLIPNPHPEDKQYCIDNGENWYPDDIDIGGCLHELMDHYNGP